MKTPPRLTLPLLLLLLLAPALASAAVLGDLRLSLIEGDVQIKTADHGDWSAAVINFPLKDGDQLWVPGDARAEVQSQRGTIVRLDAKTALDILTVDKDALQLYLSRGLAYVNAKAEPGTTLQIDTPRAALRVYEQAKFSAEVFESGDAEIKVFLGAISTEDKKGETAVGAGKVLSLDSAGAELSPLTATIGAWERWNGERDKALEGQRESVRYLPEELAGYSQDFDSHGDWHEVSGYGRVWRPRVQENDWSPYRRGRWVWVDDDYVWIAYEPWGWAPYHYGRWAFVGRHGWCWVPPARHEVYWGPGYVGWVQTPTYVAWVPLAPREMYYGHGHYYGPHSVDTVHINVNTVVVKNVYKNVTVNNAVTTVPNETFIQGKGQGEFKVEGNPFQKERIRPGRPQLAPEAATKVASSREIPEQRRPPATVKESKVEEVKAQRPLVPQRGQSVFAPDKAPKPMPVQETAQSMPHAPRDRGVVGTPSATPPAITPTTLPPAEKTTGGAMSQGQQAPLTGSEPQVNQDSPNRAPRPIDRQPPPVKTGVPVGPPVTKEATTEVAPVSAPAKTTPPVDQAMGTKAAPPVDQTMGTKAAPAVVPEERRAVPPSATMGRGGRNGDEPRGLGQRQPPTTVPPPTVPPPAARQEQAAPHPSREAVPPPHAPAVVRPEPPQATPPPAESRAVPAPRPRPEAPPPDLVRPTPPTPPQEAARPTPPAPRDGAREQRAPANADPKKKQKKDPTDGGDGVPPEKPL